MKTFALAALLGSALVFAAAPKPAAAPAAPAAPAFVLGGDAAKGETTYKTMCAPCHGDKGKGDGAAAATLNPKPADFTDPARAASATDEYIYKMVKDGGAANGKSPLMVAWGPVLGDDAKVRDVAAFVRKVSGDGLEKRSAALRDAIEGADAGKAPELPPSGPKTPKPNPN